MYARSTTIQAQTSAIDEGIAHVRDQVMPAIQGMEGYVGLSMLVDRQSGRCIATSAWQSEEAMRASDDQLRPIRDRAAEILGGTAQVDEWEIAMLHRDHRSRDGASVRATWTQIEPAQMERAIERVDADTYGRCESCGNPIPKARLQAFPSATLCVTCKQREERR